MLLKCRFVLENGRRSMCFLFCVWTSVWLFLGPAAQEARTKLLLLLPLL